MMRPNATGWILMAFFLIAGIAFMVVIPGILIGQIWVVVALAIGAYYLFLNRRADAAADLRQRGIAGQARIVEMTQTGAYVNEQPRVRLNLHIEAPGVTPFDVKKTYTVPMIALGTLTNGRPLPVYIDSDDHTKFALDWSGAATGGATIQPEGGAPIDMSAIPAAQQAVMETLRKHGVDPSGQVDLRDKPEVRAAVLETLTQQGVAVGEEGPAAGATAAEQTQEPLARLQELMEMKNAQLITDEEFAKKKAEIIGDV